MIVYVNEEGTVLVRWFPEWQTDEPAKVYMITYADGHTVECIGTDSVDAGLRASRTYPGVAYHVTPTAVGYISGVLTIDRMEVATRPEPGATWGPPVTVTPEKRG